MLLLVLTSHETIILQLYMHTLSMERFPSLKRQPESSDTVYIVHPTASKAFRGVIAWNHVSCFTNYLPTCKCPFNSTWKIGHFIHLTIILKTIMAPFDMLSSLPTSLSCFLNESIMPNTWNQILEIVLLYPQKKNYLTQCLWSLLL